MQNDFSIYILTSGSSPPPYTFFDFLQNKYTFTLSTTTDIMCPVISEKSSKVV